MAKLVKCNDCGKVFSKSAKTCPHCGKPQKRTSGCAWLVLIGLMFILVAVLWGRSSDAPRRQFKPVVSRPTSTPSKQDRLKSQFSTWDGSHRNVVKKVKTSLHNPDSFEHVETTYVEKEDYLLVKMVFRGTNLFNAVVTNTCYAKVSLDGEVLDIEFVE